MTMHSDKSDPLVDSILLIGQPATGKSSLCNIICLQDNLSTLPNKYEQYFPTNALDKLSPADVAVFTCKSERITQGKLVRVIDIPCYTHA